MVPGMGGNTVDVQLQASGAGQFSGAFAGAISSLQSFQGAVAGAGVAMAALSAGGIAKSISAASDFDAAMNQSLAIMGNVSNAMRNDMSNAAREVAKTTTFSAEEAAESYFFLASAGLDAEQSIQALPQVAKFAQAGMFDMATATDLLTDAQSALGLAVDDPIQNLQNMTRVSDVLVKANTLANASVEQFAEALTNKAAPAMRQLGIPLEQGTAALAVFADQGVKGRRAGTIFARTIEGLAEQARKNADAFEEMGINVFDANGEMRPMADIVGDMETAFAGMSTEQKEAALAQLGFNRQARQGILMLLGNSEQLREYEKELSNAGGTTDEIAKKQLETFKNQMELLKSAIADVGISIGMVFLPHLTKLAKLLRVGIGHFTRFNDATNGVAGAVILLSGLFGGLLIAGIAIISMMGGIATVTATAAAVFGGLAAALGTVLLPIGLLVAAVAALYFAWQNNLFGIRDITFQVIEIVRSTLQNFIATVQQFWEQHGNEIIATVMSAYETVKTTIQNVLTFIWQNVVQPFIQTVQELWAEHGQALMEEASQTWALISEFITRALFDLIIPIILSFIEFAQRIWQVWGEDILTVTRFIFDTIISVAGAALDLLATTIRVIMAVIRGDWQLAWQLIADFFRGIFTGIEEFIANWGRRFFEWLSGFVNGVIQWFVTLAKRLIGGSIIPEMLAAIRNAFVLFFQFILEQVQAFVEKFLGFARWWFETLVGIVRGGIEIVRTIFTNFNTFLRELWTALTQWFTERAAWLRERLVQITSALHQRMREAWNTFRTFLRELWTALTQWFTERAAWLQQRLVAITSALHGALRGLWAAFNGFLRGIWSALTQWVSERTAWLRQRVSQITSALHGALRGLWNAFNGFLRGLWSALTQWVTERTSWLQQRVQSITSALHGALRGLWNAFRGFLRGLWTALTNWFAQRTDWLRGRVTQITSALHGALRGLWSSFNGFLRGLWSSLTSWFINTTANLRSRVVSIFQNIRSVVTNVMNQIRNAVVSGMNRARSGFVSALNTMRSRAQSILNRIVAAFRNALSRVQSIASRIIGAARRAQRLASGALSRARSMANRARSVVPGLQHGGIVTAPTLAMVGEGGEPEAVIPLSKLDKFLTPEFSTGTLDTLASDRLPRAIERQTRNMLDAHDLEDAVERGIRDALRDGLNGRGSDGMGVEVRFEGNDDDPIVEYIRRNASILVRDELSNETRRVRNLRGRPEGL